MASTRYKLQRYKFQDYPSGIVDIDLWRYSASEKEQFCKKKIEVIGGYCSKVGSYKYLKYLSADGQYKFIPFEKSWTIQQENSALGSTTDIITSPNGPMISSTNIGVNSQVQLVLSTTVDKSQYQEYANVLSSPRVYLQEDTDQLEDGEENWILVTVDGNNSYNTKKPRERFVVTITLPKYNNIKM